MCSKMKTTIYYANIGAKGLKLGVLQSKDA